MSIFPAPSLSVALSLSPTVHTVCHSFISLSLLPLSFLLFFPLWLSLSPNVTVFLSFSLSLPACLSFYHSLSYHVTLSIFFSICGSLSLSPTPDPVSLSIFNSLTHPVSLCIFLYLPPNFYFFLTLCGSASFSQHVSLFIFSLCLPCFLSLPTLSLFQSFSLSHPVSFSLPPLSLSLPPTLFLFHTVSHSIFLSPPLSLFLSCYLPHTVSFSSTMSLYLPLRLSHKERER